jgi:hypothetical protein
VAFHCKLLLTVFAFLYRTMYFRSITLKEVANTTTPSVTPVPTGKPLKDQTVDEYIKNYSYLAADHVTSLDGKFTAYFQMVEDYDDRHGSFRFAVSGLSNEDIIVQGPDNLVTSLYELPLTDLDKKYKEDLYDDFLYLNPSSHLESIEAKIVWSPDGSKLAAFVPGHIIIGSFTRGVNKYPSIFDTNEKATEYKNGTKLVLDNVKDIPISFTSGRVKLLFAGDMSKIYIGYDNDTKENPDRIYEINLATSILKEYAINTYSLSTSSVLEIYPVPNSSGIAYWQSDEDNTPYITVETNGIKRKYDPNLQSDYPGKILFSPDMRYVCFSHGSSGYIGYAIYEIPSMRKLAIGQQYSYCDKWLSNTELIVVENPYYHQSYWYSYLYDVRTKNKKLLTEFPNKEYSLNNLLSSF